MINYRTLSTYLFLLYLKFFFITTIVITCFLILAGIFDVLQDFKNYTLPFKMFSRLIILKIPILINEIVAPISFISMLFFINTLNKNNELMIIIGNGVSIGKLLLIPIITNFFLGIVFVMLISPLSTYSVQKLDLLESKVTKKKSQGFAFLSSNILFFEEYENENRIIKAQSFNTDTNQFNNSSILILNQNNDLVKRMDAEKIILSKNILHLINVKIMASNTTIFEKELVMNTNFNIDNFSKRYLTPQKIYIWDLHHIINKFAKSGLPTTDYKVFYYKQIFKPFYMIAMALVACCFIRLNNNRDNKQNILLILGLLTSVFVYAALEIIVKLLVSNGMTPLWAILLPIFLIIALGNFVILHFY